MTASVTVLVLLLEMLHCKGVHRSGGAGGGGGGGGEGRGDKNKKKRDLV